MKIRPDFLADLVFLTIVLFMVWSCCSPVCLALTRNSIRSLSEIEVRNDYSQMQSYTFVKVNLCSSDLMKSLTSGTCTLVSAIWNLDCSSKSTLSNLGSSTALVTLSIPVPQTRAWVKPEMSCFIYTSILIEVSMSAFSLPSRTLSISIGCYS